MNPANTAPKDQQFLGDFGWPWLCMTCWNDASQKWAYANYQVNIYQGGWNDPYYETESESEPMLRGWLPLPIIP